MRSLRKSRSLLKEACKWYKKKGHKLRSETLKQLETALQNLDNACLANDRKAADTCAQKVEELLGNRMKHSAWEHATELFFALLFALVLATLVKQAWFELYEIPTGSMRPTFKEQDHLTVSKTQFGINIPLITDHFYFDPDGLQRTGVVIFSGDGVDLPNTDSTFLKIFPYKKRYIKRLIGKPGDSLYFYGGKIYGVDKEGKFIQELIDSPSMQTLEHIPFLSFEGAPAKRGNDQILFSHMHEPLGKLTLSSFTSPKGVIFSGKEWIEEDPSAAKTPHKEIRTYSDKYGIGNFAMARLLTKQQVKTLTNTDPADLEEGLLYLELRHHPSLNNPKLHQEGFGYTIRLNPLSTIIPLQEKHLHAIRDNLYTARFEISDGKARRYSAEQAHTPLRAPLFPNTPDGTYEFYNGKGTKIHWGGIPTELPKDHPLYDSSPKTLQKLFNMGISFDKTTQPRMKTQVAFPQRYAYFREGDLYLLGGPVYKKEDPLLTSFHKREMEREKNGSYVAFKDWGPPFKKGEVNEEFIRTFGVTVPEKHYFVLGDNHAMSADSRIFGFVPEENLQGVPSLIIWPPFERLGTPSHTPYAFFTLPRILIWSIVALITSVFYFIQQRNNRRPQFKKRRFPSNSTNLE